MGTEEGQSNALFVKLPTTETFTLRNLPDILPVRTLGARLELMTSLPVSCFQLWYGERLFSLGDTIKFGEAGDRVRNGSLLKLSLYPQHQGLYECLSTEAVAGFLEGGDGDGERECRAVVVMCACCKTGDVDLLKQAAPSDASRNLTSISFIC